MYNLDVLENDIREIISKKESSSKERKLANVLLNKIKESFDKPNSNQRFGILRMSFDSNDYSYFILADTLTDGTFEKVGTRLFIYPGSHHILLFDGTGRYCFEIFWDYDRYFNNKDYDTIETFDDNKITSLIESMRDVNIDTIDEYTYLKQRKVLNIMLDKFYQELHNPRMHKNGLLRIRFEENTDGYTELEDLIKSGFFNFFTSDFLIYPCTVEPVVPGARGTNYYDLLWDYKKYSSTLEKEKKLIKK